MKLVHSIFVYTIVIIVAPIAYTQTDTLVLNTGEVIVGDLKSMGQNVLTIETRYSDSDFKIEWDQVVRMSTGGEYIISLESRKRMVSSIRTDMEDSTKLVIYDEGRKMNVEVSDIVFFKGVDAGFWDRLSASIDIGFSLTKANNLRQFSSRSSLGYLTNNWSADASVDAVRSSQDSIPSTSRTDAAVSFNYFLWKGWFLWASASFLQNDEQKLELRSTPKVGIGNYIIQTNNWYWSLYLGAAWNNENYTDPTIPNRSDAEALIGTELNLFDIGDLRFLTSLTVFRAVSEGDRTRADFKLDLKYDLPLDFYIGLGYTLNYDSQPVEGASESDYVFQTTFGWEL